MVSPIFAGFLLSLGAAGSSSGETVGALENGALVWRWRLADGQFRPAQLEDKLNQKTLSLTGECFQLALDDNTILKASDFTLDEAPQEKALNPEPASPMVAGHFPGRQLVVKFSSANRKLRAEWRAQLRDGSTYLREELLLRPMNQDVLVKKITLLDEEVSGAKTAGTVDGSPVVAGDFFFGYEQPMAQNIVNYDNHVRCAFVRNAVLKTGETLKQSCVLGVTLPGQLRRGFLAYLERERARPYQPFLHYNSWYDIAWADRKYDETQSLEAINQLGQQLQGKRGVKIDSFLFDDGWDDNRTLWKFHNGFPTGFASLKPAARRYGAGIGVWLSPFGGYAEAKQQRLKYGAQFGFETNASGFSLAGPKYYQRFHEICLEMVQKYGANTFKFDGLAAGAKASENGLTRDGDAMLRLLAGLREASPSIYLNQTTGTWPSPFWLLFVDSTWRGGDDHWFLGKGSWCQQWMTYRDAQTYRNVVQRAPLYPLNSLMLHGIIYATNAVHLNSMSAQDFAAQVRSFFGTGTQLQEMYVTPALLNKQNWDDLAEAAKWARTNVDVLADTHWIGGDPAKGEVYGWASWCPRRGILTLRNPDEKPASFIADIGDLLELPQTAPRKFLLRSPWKEDNRNAEICVGKTARFALAPFEVVTLETTEP